jgi:hypothetical protein
VTITGLPIYSGPFTASARRIYRTVVCPTSLCTVITANQAPRNWYYVATINDNVTTTYVDTTADASLGPHESSTPSKSIALGAYATVYGSYQMVVGSDASPVQQIWLGNGMVSALSPAGVVMSSSGASGTNVTGQDLILGGGPGTGSANGGNVIFGTVPGGASGSLWNSLVDRWKIDSATGNLMSLSTGGINGVTGTVDFSGTAHALPAKVGVGASKPSTCTVGEQYFATDAAAGQNLFGCTAVNTWTVEGGGGGGSGGAVSSVFGRTGAVTAQSGDYTTTQVTEGTNLYFTTARAAAAAPVQSVLGRTGVVTAAANDYNLSQISSGTLSATGGAVYNPAGTGNTQIVFKNSSSQAGNGIGSVLWQNNAGSTMSFINWDGGFAEGDGTNYKISLDTSTLSMSSDSLVAWRSVSNVFSGASDIGLARESAGIVKVTNGASGYGTLDAGGLSINGTALATTLAGDVTGAFGVNTVGKLQGLAVSSAAPTSGQVLQWNGSQWAPGTGSGGAVSSVFGRTGAVTAQNADYTLTQIGAGTLSATGGTVYNPAGTGNTQIVFKNSSSQAGNGIGSVLWQNNAGSTMSFINWDGGFAEGDGTNYKISLDTSTLGMSSDSLVAWRSVNNVFSGAPDTGLARESAGIVKVTNGASGYGTLDTGGLSINGTALATTLAGDVTGAFGGNTVGKIQGLAVSSTVPASGQVLQWNGSQWAPATVSGGGGAVSSVFGRSGAVIAGSGDYSYSQISGTLPDAALPSDAVTTSILNNSTVTASLVSLATTSGISSGGALTANGNVYANAGSNAAGCLHLADANGVHDMGICAPSSGFNGLLNLWSAAGTAGQVTTTDGANNLLWSNLGGIAGTLTSAQMPTLTGDLSNSGLATTVTALQGRAVASTAPAGSQVLQWNGSQWAPGTVSGGAVSSVFGRTGAVAAATGDYTLTQIGAGTLSATGGTVYNSASGQNTQIVIQNGANQSTSGTASVLWKNNAGSNIAFINWDGGYAEGDGTNYKISIDTSTLSLSSDSLLAWHSVNNTFSGVLDTGLLRESAGIVKVTDGASGYGAVDAGGYSASGAAGVTSTTCTQWTNGLCTHN